MKAKELKRIIENHFEAENDRRRAMCNIGAGVVGLSKLEMGIGGVTHYQNQCRAELNRNPEFAAKYVSCLRECCQSAILFPSDVEGGEV
jgi:hypothetical protein